MSNDLFDGLNDGQQKAATTKTNHVLVLAGAGTGKTTTIVARCSQLIVEGVAPTRIQILTFTRRAAQEIRGRVESKLGPRAQGLGASTFHAWCMSIVRRNADVFGYEGWTVIDRDDQLQLFRLLRGKRARGAFPTPANLLDAYSYARNTLRGLKDSVTYKLPNDEHHLQEIVNIARDYEARKKARNYLDYDDILAIVAGRLRASEDIARWLGQSTQYLLVDEMQDTNPLQWEILSPLLPFISLFCVGDDAQAIYSFRGADFRNIHSFLERVPNGEILRLTENYRSTQEILDLSNWLLEESSLSYNKKLRAARGPGLLPEIHSLESDFDEANWILDQIESDQAEGNSFADSLILTRSAWGGRPVEAALLQRKIPYVFYGGTKLLESAHIKDALALLRCVANRFDELAWMRFLTLYPGIGDVRAGKLIDFELSSQGSGDENSEWESQDSEYLPPEVASALTLVSEARETVEGAVEAAMRALFPILSHKYRNENWEARAKDFIHLRQLAKGHSSILGFIESYLIDPLYLSELSGDKSKDSVVVSTIHSAKGLEAKTAYVIAAHAGNFPSSAAIGNAEIEEERRVLYVAMTRAADRLVITRLQRSHSAQREIPLSGEAESAYFLAELPEALANDIGHFAEQVARPVLPAAEAVEVDLSVPL